MNLPIIKSPLYALAIVCICSALESCGDTKTNNQIAVKEKNSSTASVDTMQAIQTIDAEDNQQVKEEPVIKNEAKENKKEAAKSLEKPKRSDSGKSGKKQDESRNVKSAVSVDGVYQGSQDLGGISLSAKLTIRGSRWTAITKLDYGDTEYQSGIVNGKDLYDETGMLKLGFVSGNTARINGYPTMRK